MITRKIGKLIRGKTTPFNIIAACILGSALGFIPGFREAPGLTLSLAFLLLITNANLFLAGVVGLLAKAVSLAALPVSFSVGQFLLDGPTTGLARQVINAPVLAWFGFEYYVVTGGLALAIVFGLIVGLILSRIVRRIREKLAGLEIGSDKFKKLTSRRSTKIAVWLFAGGLGAASYKDLLRRRVGNPIRLWGLLLVVILVAALYFAKGLITEKVLHSGVKGGLEAANGATVDIERVSLDIPTGKFQITRLAMADPEALNTDLFRASTITADLNLDELLRKRFTIDQLLVADAISGEPRATPGVRLGKTPTPPPPPPPADNEKTIDDYIKEAKQWKERLAQIKRWLEQFGRKGEDPGAGDPNKTPKQKKEELEERLRREVRAKGYTKVFAGHLIEKSPTVLIRELSALGVKDKHLEAEIIDVTGRNLSTQPWLAAEKPSISVKARSGKLEALVEFAGSKPTPTSPPGPGAIVFKYNGIPADAVGSQLASATGGEPPIKGGTIDVAIDGTWSQEGVGYLDLPLQVTLRNSTVSIPGAGSALVSELAVPIHVRGPMDNPQLKLDPKHLADALLKAGAAQLADKVRGEVTKEVDKAMDKAKEKIGEQIGDKAKDLLPKDLLPKDLLPGGKKKN